MKSNLATPPRKPPTIDPAMGKFLETNGLPKGTAKVREQAPADITTTDVVAEKAVLGYMLRSPEVCQPIESEIILDYFTDPATTVIRAAICEARRKSIPAIPATINQLLRESGRLEAAGGEGAVAQLLADAPDLDSAGRHYLNAIRTCWLRRSATQIAETLRQEIETSGNLDAFADAQKAIERIQRVSCDTPVLHSLMQISSGTPDPRKTVLGKRWLCVGGAALFIGPSGIGKSSASNQQDILWSLGRPAFGIHPARPLKILTIQAENDDEDLAEMRDGVCRGLQLTPDERAQVEQRVFYETENARSGQALLAHIERLLRLTQFDIIRLDPLLAYLGADVNDAQETAAFLRHGLNPLLTKYQVAAIINHHTPKVTNRDTSTWRGSDWGYAGAGSADITNWARAALVIDPTHANHVFKFIAAKRASRIGWVDEFGERETIRHYCHASDGLYWREATQQDLNDAADAQRDSKGSRAPEKTKDDLLALVPLSGAVGKNVLISKANDIGIGLNKARNFISALIGDELLFEHFVKRKGTNDECRLSRKPLMFTQEAE